MEAARGGGRFDGTMDDEEDRRLQDKVKGSARRQGVAAVSVDRSQVIQYVPPVYPKDEASCGQLRHVIKTNEKMQVLFGHLDQVKVESIIGAFQERRADVGEDLIRQGEQGDRLYIVQAGLVDVFVARPGADGVVDTSVKGPKVVSLGAGALFGELALMYTAPRAASVTVAEPSILWSLDQEPFKMLLMQQGQSQYEMYEGWLSEVDILKVLNHYELSRLSELLQAELFDGGEVIIQQGDAGDKFYILEDGSCAAFINGDEGEKEVKTYDEQGAYFGEIALLTDARRKATIRATGTGAAVLSISKDDFVEVLGPIQDILKQHVDEYPHYAEFLMSAD
eukprot:TRINITY_DN18449_c0_g1_i1.p2 TRINITY_DN18449_c0_g1~~TRINITY_DN18449_c0_g1_i1.p2  ORF type:complete len:337 (-),score=75.79 TRINITY_DN18449_c0_g1_i1:128-1138(-)